MWDRDMQQWMQGWFERLVAHMGRLEKLLEKTAMKEKILDGERLMDNQDVCQLLNVSKRTLQRYRSIGELPYQMLYHKTFYKQSDVEAFIKANFAKKNKGGSHTEDTGSDPDDTEPATP